MRHTLKPVRREYRWRPPVIKEHWMWSSWRNDLASMRTHRQMWNQVAGLVRLLWAHSSREAGVTAVLSKCPPQWSRWWMERVPYFVDYDRGVYDAFWNVELPAACRLRPSDPDFIHETRLRARAAIEYLYDARPGTPDGIAQRYAHADFCRVRDTPSFCRGLEWGKVKLPDALQVVEPEVYGFHHASDLAKDRGV